MKRRLIEMQDPTADLEVTLTELEGALESAQRGLSNAHPREQSRYEKLVQQLSNAINLINNIIVTKARQGMGMMSTDSFDDVIVSSRQYGGPGLNEIRHLVRFMINEAKKKEAKEPKESKNAKKKRKPKLEEQEQMWGGRRSRWYMPRLSDY